MSTHDEQDREHTDPPEGTDDTDNLGAEDAKGDPPTVPPTDGDDDVDAEETD